MENENMRWEMTLDLSLQILCGFYNLDLDHFKEVRDFLERHGPIKNMDDEVERLKKGGGEITYQRLTSLESYEDQNGVPWFDSEDFKEFKEYWNICRSLVDSVLTNHIDTRAFNLFCQQLKENAYKLSIDLRRNDGTYRQEVEHAGEMPTSVSLDDWQIISTHRFDTMAFGLQLGSLMYDISNAMRYTMKYPQTVGRCRAGPTPRRSACQNIFYHKKRSGPKQRWCSSRCKRRMHAHGVREREKAEDRSYFRRIKG